MHPLSTKVNDKLTKKTWCLVTSHMAIIPFPILFKCRNVSKETKMTKITSSINQRIKRIKHFWLFWFFKLRHWSFYNPKYWFVCWSVEKKFKIKQEKNQRTLIILIIWLFETSKAYCNRGQWGNSKSKRQKNLKKKIVFLIFFD